MTQYIPTCESCRFMQRLGEPGGVCRRRSPAAGVVVRVRPAIQTGPWPGNDSATIWPPVANADWCGEWTSKQDPS